MAFTVEHAKRMRAAYEPVKAKQVVQIGHQSCSSGNVVDAKNFLEGGRLGKITAVDATMYRNTPHGKPQWSRAVLPGMNAENIVWNKFLGETPKIAFDANRYLNWRFFWDYSGGNVYENMCHQVAFWYKVLELKIPQAVTMTGGLYLWKDGREVPDTMNVSMTQPEEMLFSWISGFGNASLGNHRTGARHGWNNPARAANSLFTGKGELAERRRANRRDANARVGAHEEFHGCDSRGQRSQLSI